MAIDLVEAREMLALYIKAEKHILQGQSYTIKDRTLTRADLATVARERKRWQSIVDSAVNGGSVRVRRVIPRDF
jgi:hypothetical protein